MKIFVEENIDSTQTYGLSLENDLPFGVLAQSQILGRGQRLKVWESPEGGLYLSLYLPLSYQEVIPTQRISLHVGYLVAFWLEQLLSIKISLKWPNDLMYLGQKLGGILCECTDDKIIIGIGLNVDKTPELDAYECVSLRDILPHVPFWDIQDLAENFCNFFETRLNQGFSFDLFRRYQLHWGQPWRDEKTHMLGVQMPFAFPDLSLRLSCYSEPIYSAGHSCRWLYQRFKGQKTSPLVLIDKNGQMELYDQAYDKNPIYKSDYYFHILEGWRSLYPETLNQNRWPLFIYSREVFHYMENYFERLKQQATESDTSRMTLVSMF